MKRILKTTLLLAALATSFTLAHTALAAASIGVNYVNNGNGGVQNGDADSLAADESAGAPTYGQTNWNNFGRWGQTVAANDSSGAASGVTVTWDSNNTWQNGASTGDPDGKLMYGYLDATGTGSGNNEYSTNSGAYHFFWNENKPEAYVTGISTWLAAQGATKYDVVIYLDGDSTGGRICETWLQQGFTGDPPTTLGSDLTSHVFVSDTANFSGTYTQVPLSASSVGSAANGNYVVFTDVTADSFILRTEERSFHAAFLAGFQIVPRTNDLPPSVTAPTSSAVYSGRTVRFAASAAGTAPLTYQWQKDGINVTNGGNISGATTGTLTVNPATAADVGGYTLIVTNVGGAVTSSVAALAIAPAPATGGYAEAIYTNGAVAHWRLGETGSPVSGTLAAPDYIGGYAGLYGTNSTPGQSGPQPATFPGLESTNAAVAMSSNLPATYVTVPTPLLNTNTVTITAWLYATNGQTDGTGILQTRGGTTAGFIILDGETNRLGYTWNNDSTATFGWNSGLLLPSNEWVFAALVIEPNKATIYLGRNGTLTNASQVLAHANEAWGTTGWIGHDSYSDERTFNGVIDEVSLFNRSLSFDEIGSLYGIATGIPQTAPPSVTSQPGSTTRYAGKTVVFPAVASGTAPLLYQWQKNGTNLANGGGISGATTDTLTLGSISAASAGTYTLFVSNAFGTNLSSPATLSVVLPTTAYESNVLAANPLAFWRLNETNDPSTGVEVAFDYWGGNNGTYRSAVQNAFNGIPGPASADGFSLFGETNSAALCANNTANGYVATPALNVTTTNLTITGWIYPSGSLVSWSGITFSRSGSPATGLNINGSGHLGYHWNDSFWDVDTGIAPPLDQWSFVAVSVEPTQATVYLYNTNGLQSYTNVSGHTAHAFTSGFRIGGDSQGDDRTFSGRVDEVTVFNRTLTRVQILDLLGVTPVTLSVQRSGSDLILSWPFGTLLEADDITGPWTVNGSTSPVTVSPTAAKKFYRVQVP